MKTCYRVDTKIHLIWLAGIVLLALTGCRGRSPAATPAPPAASLETPASLPAVESAVVMAPEQGGTLELASRAQVTLPPQALSATATVTLREMEATLPIPIPRSLIGQAYEIKLDGGELTGVALLRLPLPGDVTLEEYDIAPYRWNGKTWERINGRNTGDSIQFGTNLPGVYALHGEWKLADASLALARPEAAPGQQTVSLVVAGQYRYSAAPQLQGDYVVAHLLLKQDTSGGAGRVSGNDALDKTVAEAPLWFKPDPGKAQAVIEFSHVFELSPGVLELAPGDSTRLYAVLNVADSAAPTRRLSSGLEYAQILPIRVIDGAIVRPELAIGGGDSLRWHVRLNGQTLLTRPAAEVKLPLDPILAQGGLGEYRFTLEVARDNTWTPVSNEVTVLLALSPTATLPPGAASPPPSTQVAITSPTSDAAQTPSGAPATPTRRPAPGGVTGATATPTPQAVAAQPSSTSTPTRPAWASIFWADRYSLNTGGCTDLHWSVENVVAVYLNGGGVTGKESRQVCPPQTTTYVLRVTSGTGTQEYPVTIVVGPANEAAFDFTADSYQVVKGQCTTLRWRVTDVQAVYLNNLGVPGESSQQICPEIDTMYELRVESNTGATTTRRVSIAVLAANGIPMRFWAERYTLQPDTCTTLHWNVQNVREVFLDEQGVSGVSARQACPDGSRFYTLRAVDNSGQNITSEVSLVAINPLLSATEVIAQGIVNDVIRATDVDPAQPGDQPGYRLVVDGINPLFTGTPGWMQAAVALGVPQSLIQAGDSGPADWPINPGQQVEFRATCDVTKCVVMEAPGSYVYLRSE